MFFTLLCLEVLGHTEYCISGTMKIIKQPQFYTVESRFEGHAATFMVGLHDYSYSYSYYILQTSYLYLILVPCTCNKKVLSHSLVITSQIYNGLIFSLDCKVHGTVE